MRNLARVTLAIVVLLAGIVILPRPGTSQAAQRLQIPTPILSDLIGSPKPSPKPSETEPGGGGGGGSGGGDQEPGDGGEDDDPDGDGENGDGKDGSGKDGEGKDGAGKDGKNGAGKKGDGGLLGGKKGKNKKKDDEPSIYPGTYRPSGPQGNFNTDELVAIATQLRSLGVSKDQVIAQVYPPWIIAGPAAWTNTWGAPRYGPGPIVRTHEGQDVFCTYGDPILAPEDGTVSFSDGGLGGITARVHKPDGSYWYLTHLSDLNTEQLSAGDFVREGTVLGFCGNSGNAATTPPHVHFGWYQSNGSARNPMAKLVAWLRTAERRARLLVSGELAERQKKQESGQLTLARRFGDTFTPDRSELRISSESLWASGSSPATGAFGLAEVALQAALARRVADQVFDPTAVDLSREGGDTGGVLLDPESELAQILSGAAGASGDAEAHD